MRSAQQILRQYWGYDSFRPLQEEIITSIINRNDTLALLPTGGGKSLCYQVPALMMEGVCLVISPLIALMQDQVGRLKELDVPAECLHSGMPYRDVKRTLDNAMHGAYKLLYISPERLQSRLFGDYMRELDVSLIAVDEAHCISQWGHDFRPNYLKIANARAVFPGAPVLALTASATPDVQADICTQLKMKHPAVYKQSFARNNIFYDIRYSENKNADTLLNAANGSTIVYCRSRKQTEAIGRHLFQSGLSVAVYHAGMNKENRENAQETWMTGEAKVMTATTAFGMGIDKPEVRTVLHYDAPEHLEAYYQEAGRAGRDGKPSLALALYNSADIKRLSESVALHYPPEGYLRQVYQAVAEYLQIPIGAEPDRYYPFDLADFCRKFSFRANEAIHALKLLEQEDLWTMTEAVYSPSTIEFTADRHTLDRLGDAHPNLHYVTVGLLRMYNTVFHFPTPVRESAIARQLRMRLDELLPILDRLDKMELLKYNRPGEGPQLFFHHYRVDSNHLIIDLNRIAILRKRHEARTVAMIAFLRNNNTCRERLLLTYFGETPGVDCGHCDVCLEKTTILSSKSLETELLRTVQEHSTIDILTLISRYQGANRERALEILRTMADNRKIAISGNMISSV